MRNGYYFITSTYGMYGETCAFFKEGGQMILNGCQNASNQTPKNYRGLGGTCPQSYLRQNSQI